MRSTNVTNDRGSEEAELRNLMLATDSKNDACWYALSTRSRHEKVVAKQLDNAGIPTFLPLSKELRRWSDRNQPVAVPIFPGYVFVQISAMNELRVQVLKTPGVVTFIGTRGVPISIPEKEIRDICSLLSTGMACSPYPFLRVGQRVRIVGGALDQIEGTLVGRGPESKLVISIELIQRSLAISVYDLDIEPVEKCDGAAA
jgi:transcription termination/antitermination protein NusG